MLLCPKCGRYEYVRISGKNSERAMCEDCELFFDVQSAEGSKPRNLKLFLSYPHAADGEYDICADIAAFLRARGHEVWFDKDQLYGVHGADWRRRISDGIKESQLVLACLNSHAVRVVNGRRGVCLDELSIAISVKGDNINTVLLEPEVSVRPTASLSHRQWLDMSQWRVVYEQGEAKFKPWFEEKMTLLTLMVEREENYTFDGEITEIAKRLTMTDFRLDKRSLLEKPFVGREWLAQRIDDWLDDPHGGNLCAIYGDPGAGKSAFAVQYAFSSANVGAIICFEHGNSHYNSGAAMIRSLAYQLACRLSDYRAQLLETLRKPGIFDLDTAELFDQLLVQPLTILKIDGGHETLCVILDGLDECSEGEKNTVVEVLGKCVKKFPVWMRVLITARRDTSVLEWIAPDRLIDLSDHDDQNTEDVREYLQQALAEKTFASDKEKDKVISRLTERSGGSFLFAFLIAQAILEGLIDPLDEDVIPDKLGKTFLLWMRRSFGSLEEYRNVFRAPLSVIISSPEPLPAEELLRLLNMSETELRDFKRRMNAFFTEGSDAFGEKTLRFEHKYISDWLAGEEAGPFSVSRRDGLKILAVRCWEQFQKEASELSGYEVVWLQKLLKQAGMTKELETVNTSTLFFDRLCNLSDQCINWGKYETAEKLCGNMLENALARTTVLQEVDNGEEPSEETLAANTDLVKSYMRMAEICMDMGEADEAFELYEKSLAIARLLDEKLSTNDTRRQVAICYGKIAGVHICKGRLDEAYDILRKCCQVHEELSRTEETPKSLAQLARIYQKIADIHRMKEEFAEALELYERVLQMREAINDEICSSETLNDISVSCERIADILKKNGKWEKALAYYERGASIMEELIEKQRTPKMLRGLLLCTSKIADIYMDEKNLDHALQLYEKCYVINQEIAQKLETPKAKMDLSVSCDRIADIHKAKGNLKMALKLYQKSLSIREELSEKLGTINLLWNLCVSQYEIAECLKAGEEYEKALPYYQKACEICDRISDILPAYSRYKEVMGEALEKCRQLCIEE